MKFILPLFMFLAITVTYDVFESDNAVAGEVDVGFSQAVSQPLLVAKKKKGLKKFLNKDAQFKSCIAPCKDAFKVEKKSCQRQKNRIEGNGATIFDFNGCIAPAKAEFKSCKRPCEEEAIERFKAQQQS